MTLEELKSIEEGVNSSKEFAQRIMNGDTEYDGADGAREVIGLCDLAEKLISEIKLLKTQII